MLYILAKSWLLKQDYILNETTYHAVCKGPPLLKMSTQAFVCRLEAQASDEQLAELLRLTWDLYNRKQCDNIWLAAPMSALM